MRFSQILQIEKKNTLKNRFYQNHSVEFIPLWNTHSVTTNEDNYRGGGQGTKIWNTCLLMRFLTKNA